MIFRLLAAGLVLAGLTGLVIVCLPNPEKAQARSLPDAASAPAPRVAAKPVADGDHALDPAIQLAEQALERMQKIHSYSAEFVKRELVGDTLGEPEQMQLKIRRAPFSVYMKFLSPSSVEDREVLYVDGANESKLLVYLPDLLARPLGILHLDPEGPIAMQGQKYPITEIGIENLTRRLITIARAERNLTVPAVVRFFENERVGEIPATRIEVTHPVRHPEHTFAKANIYFDAEHLVPIRYEGYAWPTEAGGEPILAEEYTYQNLRLNDLSEKDFERANPDYPFGA